MANDRRPKKKTTEVFALPKRRGRREPERTAPSDNASAGTAGRGMRGLPGSGGPQAPDPGPAPAPPPAVRPVDYGQPIDDSARARSFRGAAVLGVLGIMGVGTFVTALSVVLVGVYIRNNPEQDPLGLVGGDGGGVVVADTGALPELPPPPTVSRGGGGGGTTTEAGEPVVEVDPNLPQPVSIRFVGDDVFKGVQVQCGSSFRSQKRLVDGRATIPNVPVIGVCTLSLTGGKAASWTVRGGDDLTCTYPSDQLLCE